MARILLTKGNCWPDEGPRVERDGVKQAGKEMVSKYEDRSESQDLAELPNPQLTEWPLSGGLNRVPFHGIFLPVPDK